MLSVRTFFAGHTICQQGDINNSMYFIHRGKVEVLSVEQSVEVVVDVLYERDCFGVVIKMKCEMNIVKFKSKFSDSRFILQNATHSYV